MPHLLLAQFDRLSDVPDAVPRLRRFVLDLAVRGKLVTQDPNDEPASELLIRIQQEKARLVKNGEIRKEKQPSRIDDSEAPFRAPAGWVWVRIRQVTSDRGQTVPDKEFTYIDVTAIDKEAGRIANAKILCADDAPSRARKLARTGDVLYSCVRPYLLNIAVIEKEIVPTPVASTAFAVLNGFGLVLSRYLWIALRSPVMVECVEAKMRGQAYPAINDSDFAMLPLALPPLAEQHRIVAKVNELMALLDRLEEAQAERERRRDRLAASALHHLSNGAHDETFREHARFYLNQLSRLTVRCEQIPVLRQTILNLALRGQLVPQDPRDEPASEILKQIDAERARLIKAGGAKEQKQARTIPPDHFPFDVPQNWCWVSLGQIAYGFRYGTSVKCAYEATGEPVLRIPNIENGRITTEDLKFGPLSKREAEDLRLQLGDILMVRSNGSLDLVGRAALVEADTVGYCYAGYLVRVRTSVKYLDTGYLLLALTTTHIRNQIEVPIRTTVGLKNVNATELSNLAIPLAPLAEQRRIVAKVDELMSLCDRLEALLTTTRTESRCLLEAVLHRALAATA